MKKVLSVLLIMLIMLPVMGVSAAEKETLGNMNFEIPDGFELVEDQGVLLGYKSTVNKYETIVCVVLEDFDTKETSDLDDFEAELLMLMLMADDNILYQGFLNGGNILVSRSEGDFEWERQTSGNGIDYLAGIMSFYGEFEDGNKCKLYANQYITIKDNTVYMFKNYGEAGENSVEAFQVMVENAYFNESEEKQEETPAEPADDTIKILIDGERIYPDSDPVIVDGRTLCPIRAVAEKLGYNVGWDNDLRKATVENSERKLEFVIGATQMAGMEMLYGPNGLPVQRGFSKALDVPAQIINNRTYLPLRAVGEALGCDVDWDGNTRTVIINSK